MSDPDINKPQQSIPEHVVIIMDGNGRWAKQQGRPRVFGHKQGVKTLRNLVEQCVSLSIPNLTVYAFSSENWQRPATEVSFLMELFMSSLQQQIDALHANGIHVNFIGDRSAFPEKLVTMIEQAEALTRANTQLNLNIAANYGGRWDILQACKKILADMQTKQDNRTELDEATLEQYISLGSLPAPDLFIRTGGERRISNYLLWQLAYTELYFTDCLWPDFDSTEFEKALDWFAGRERRFGRISEQVQN